MSENATNAPTDYENEPYESIDQQYGDPNDPNAEPVVPQGWTIGEPVNDLPQSPEDAQAQPEHVAEKPQEAAQQHVEALPKEAPDNAPAAPADREETVLSAKELSALKNKLRAEAEREVLANHRDEYHEIASSKFAAHGLEFTRRLSEAERAKKQLQELLAKNPELAKEIKG